METQAFKSSLRSHACGHLNAENLSEKVTLCGWVDTRRDHGGLIFVDLRDRLGLVQVVFNPQDAALKSAKDLRSEFVIQLEGVVQARPPGMINAKIATGEIEVSATSLKILSEAQTPPIQVDDDKVSEVLKLKYRYLDIRSPRLQNILVLRHEVAQVTRQFLSERGFIEVETPILYKSTPEGARDFLVPSRLNQGKFYALPQAPQIFKQLLMVSNFDKYFQIAPCFRDEDARADRSPGEFYQLDFEMAFAEQEDVLSEIEPVIFEIFKEFSDKKVSNLPFKRITYKDSINNYGTDKPDLRNPLLINDLTDCFVNSGFKIFEENVKKGMVVKGIKAPKSADMPRAWFDKLNAWARNYGQKGLGYIINLNQEFKGPIASNIRKENLDKLIKRVGLESGDSVFFISDKKEDANKFASVVRTELCNQLKLLEKDSFQFCWIVDYPMFEINQTTNKIDFSHNPFSMPQGGMDSLLNKNPLDILAWQFDIVCNGVELSSGAIRNHKTDIMIKAFEIAGYSHDDLMKKFGFLFNAFKFGAPPHGGSAPGIDRIVMLLSGEENLREVVAFPMNQQAEDLMLGSPSKISEKHLKELGLNLKKIEKTT